MKKLAIFLAEGAAANQRHPSAHSSAMADQAVVMLVSVGVLLNVADRTTLPSRTSISEGFWRQ